MRRSLLLVGSMVLALAACTSTAPNSDTTATVIKIGFIGPLTGDAATVGADTLNGVKMAVDEMNAKGGIGGKKIELVAEDGKCSAADAATSAQKLIAIDKVVAIIGGICSGETLAAAPIANLAKIPLLSPSSSSPDVTNAGEYVFRNYPSDALKTIAMVQYMKDQGWKHVAMVTENTDFAMGFRAAIKKQMGADAVVFDEVVEPGTKDFRTLLTKLKGKQFDVFFPNLNSDVGIGAALTQLRDQNFTQPTIGHDVADSANLLTIAPKGFDGMNIINVPNVGEGTSFETNFNKKFGKAQATLAFAAHSYDATMVTLNIIGKAGMDGPKIKDGFIAMKDYKGVIGTFHFDRNGDVVGVPYVLKQVKEGKITKVSDIVVK